MSYHSLYAAFEIHPSRKGASTHISQMVNVLAESCPPALVCAIKGEEVPSVRNTEFRLFDRQIIHYIDRGRTFSAWLREILRDYRAFEIAHFRDVWSGLPILESGKAWFTVFEANGFPSIELPYRYPDLSPGTIRKFRALEVHCLVESDLVICPSETIRQYIISLGIPPSKIRVITNGADIPVKRTKPAGLPERYIAYFGAMQMWQGIDVLIKAFKYLKDLEDIHLVICSSQREKFSKPYKKVADDYGIGANMHWKYMLNRDQLNAVIGNSLFTAAPLKETTRNIVQGCSPLKIFESMANGKTVLASDLPAVREIITDGWDGILVRPDRPSELSRKIRMLADDPARMAYLGENARETILKKFLWNDIRYRLSGLYKLNRISAA